MQKINFINKSRFSKNDKLNKEKHPYADSEKRWASLQYSSLYKELNSSSEGLSSELAKSLLDEIGPNEVMHEKPVRWWEQLIEAFINPFIGILAFIAIVSYIIDVWLPKGAEKDYSTLIVIAIMIVVSVTLRFIQEFRSSSAAERLKEMVETTATVFRDGKRFEIDIKDLVPGDVLWLSAGDMIPADCRILQAKDLFIIQSALTGESLPVEKKALVEINSKDFTEKSTLELENLCFMGTNVVSGSAKVMILTTGSRTYFGSIGKAVAGKRTETSFDKGLKKVSYLLISFMMVMVPVVFLINGLAKHDWLEALLFAVAIAVGLTPEMLPMIVTANLAKGAVNMSKRKVIVKRLNAIQNIGAMDMLCTDKTGTLTLDKVVLERYLNIDGETDDEVLKWTYMNSYYQTGLKSLLDMAILNHAELHEELKIDENFTKIDELPFDFQRRKMSVVLKQKSGKHLLICKGAVEEMLNSCNRVFDPGDDRLLQIATDEVIPLTEEIRSDLLRRANNMNKEGLRVLIMAVREFEPREPNYTLEDEKDLILAGFVGFLDPAKPSASEAVNSLQELNVRVKVLTGDNEAVTKKVCKDVGIPFDKIILGNQLEKMTDEELKKDIPNVHIFAKLSPLQKERIVRTMQIMGHCVGFMGDGINDAAALKTADVGISVDTAVDIAKESADVILLEKDLTVLRKGVVYGRRTFGNIIKYIKMTTSSNFGNMLSMLGASIFLPFLPMLPLQILIQNLLYDFSQTAIPWDNMDREFIEHPKIWDASGIKRFMLSMGMVSSIFDYITFAVMWFVFMGATHQSLFQTGWFVEGLLSQTLIVHMIRTRKVPFIHSCATTPVMIMTAFVMLIGILLPFSPIAAALHMTPLPLSYFPYLVGILLAYCFLAQFVKNIFIKRYNEWL